MSSTELANAETPSQEPLEVVYIMGYGRSGSTVLDIMLGNHPDMTSVGELTYLPDWERANLPCACSRPLQECEFWSSVRALMDDGGSAPREPGLAELTARVESRRRLIGLLRNRLPPTVVGAYGGAMAALFGAVSRVSGTRTIVDSSKSAGRAAGRVLALKRHTDLKVKAIHLVRDGRAVTWASLKGPGTPELEYPDSRRVWFALRVICSWFATNLLCLLVGRQLPKDSVLLVRYEDLISNPRGELTRIGHFLDRDMEPIIHRIEQGQPLSVGHNVGGNRLRFESGIVLRPDVEWTRRMPAGYRLLFWILAGPLATRLGYRFVG